VDSSFARVHAEPMASERGRHLLVLLPVKDWPEPPKPEEAPRAAKAKAATPAMPAVGVKP